MLINSIATLQQFTEANTQLTWAAVKPSVQAAELSIIPLIGQALYDELETASTGSPVTANSQQLKLIEKIQAAVSPYALYIFAPKAEASFSDNGLKRTETNTHKSAFQYQLTGTREQLRLDGELHTEQLLSWLDANKADFPAWTTSIEYKRYKSLFIKTGSELNFYFTTATPWRNYMAMRPSMKSVEEQTVKAILGKEFYNTLKEKDQGTTDPSWSDEEKELLEKLKHVIANTTIVWTLPNLNARLDDRGLTMYSEFARATGDDDGKRGKASMQQIDHLLRNTQQAADRWLTDLKNYLTETASETVFPEYYAWQQEINPEPETFTYTPSCNDSTYGML